MVRCAPWTPVVLGNCGRRKTSHRRGAALKKGEPELRDFFRDIRKSSCTREVPSLSVWCLLGWQHRKSHSSGCPVFPPIPSPSVPLSTLQRDALTVTEARLEVKMESLLLSRGALSSPIKCRFIPALVRCADTTLRASPRLAVCRVTGAARKLQARLELVC